MNWKNLCYSRNLLLEYEKKKYMYNLLSRELHRIIPSDLQVFLSFQESFCIQITCSAEALQNAFQISWTSTSALSWRQARWQWWMIVDVFFILFNTFCIRHVKLNTTVMRDFTLTIACRRKLFVLLNVRMVVFLNAISTWFMLIYTV